jgi:hypothetical protein
MRGVVAGMRTSHAAKPIHHLGESMGRVGLVERHPIMCLTLHASRLPYVMSVG